MLAPISNQQFGSQSMYKGSAPCPTCGVIVNPVEFLQNKGRCLNCVTQERATRAQNRMA